MKIADVQNRLIADIRARLGPKAVLDDPQDVAPWLTDWRGDFVGKSQAVIQPADTAAVADVVSMARSAGVALVPQGGNTSMCGGATPLPDGGSLILSLRRLNRIRDLNPDSNLAVAEAGVILAQLHDAAEAIGRRFPLTLGAKGSATIGGLISTNAGGTQVLRHGTMRALVAGIEAVMPDGSIHHGLSALKKDNRGYDLTQLLIGAEGTLGVVTAASLKLVSAITHRVVAWVGVPSPQSALKLLRNLERRGDAVESFELIDSATLAAAVEHVAGIRAPLKQDHAWHVLVEVVTSEPGDVSIAASLEAGLAKALEAGLIEDAVIAASESQAEAFWHIRHSLSEAERAVGPATQHDISVPVDSMPEFILEAGKSCEDRFPGTQATCFGHLGDGNLHFHVRAPADTDIDAWRENTAPLVRHYVDDLVTAAGGSISAEHGIGQLKIRELERLAEPSRIGALRAIKQAFDPGNLFNPGKLVRLAPDDTAP